MIWRILAIGAGALIVHAGLEAVSATGEEDPDDELPEGGEAETDGDELSSTSTSSSDADDDEAGSPELEDELEEIKGSIGELLEELGEDRLSDELRARIEELVETSRDANTEVLKRLRSIEERLGRESEAGQEGDDDGAIDEGPEEGPDEDSSDTEDPT